MRGRRIFDRVDPYLAPAWQDPPEPEDDDMADVDLNEPARAIGREMERWGYTVPPLSVLELCAARAVDALEKDAMAAAKSEKEH